MQGAGNDFVVIDGVTQSVRLTEDNIRFLADRHFGIGADQVLLVEASEMPGADFKYRIFNQDGGEVEMCGNGARCFVRFVFDHNLTAKKRIRVETMKGIIEPELLNDGNVRVDMGSPCFAPESLPFIPTGLPSREINGVTQWAVDYKGTLYWFSICSMGNPHVTLHVENMADTPVEELGRFIENHPAFPNRVNVGFLEIIDLHHANFRVWERGAGVTLACGTGNCAAFATAYQLQRMDSTGTMINLGGTLRIEWEGEGMPIFLIGPAEEVFTSEVEI
jgi:diaminopimelate epimerase